MRKLTREERLRAAKVLETFLTEAAVLIAVFPILDEFIQYGREGVTLRLVVISLGTAVILLGIAMSIAVSMGEE